MNEAICKHCGQLFRYTAEDLRNVPRLRLGPELTECDVTCPHCGGTNSVPERPDEP
jgi:hypothetical protein